MKDQARLARTIDPNNLWQRSLSRPVQDKLPMGSDRWSSVESTVKIARAGLPIVYAIIGGNPRYFKKLIQSYREIGSEADHASDETKG